jgi:CheY-like chemotaxis protein
VNWRQVSTLPSNEFHIAPRAAHASRTDLKKKRILVVDDEQAVTDALVRFLEIGGLYEVIAINDATKAVEVARAFNPDLIVLDIIMPTLDGGKVLAELRGDREFSDLRTVFLTGLVSEEEIGSEGYAISGHTVFPKLVGAGTFWAVVAAQLGIRC